MGGKGRFISSEVYWGAGELSPPERGRERAMGKGGMWSAVCLC